MFRPSHLLGLIVLANIAVIIFAITLGEVNTGNPSRYFGEGRFTTAISCAQLLAVAFFAVCIFRARRRAVTTTSVRPSRFVWLLVAAGFVFLACDDALQIHEQLDYLIRRAFHLPKTPLTDRIDDALIGVYGLIGLAVLWICRREVLQFRREMQWPLIAGFVCLVLSILCDSATNNRQFLLSIAPDLATAKWLDGWISTGDGAFMLLGEGFFLAAFALGWRAAASPMPSSLRGKEQPLEVGTP